MHWVSRFVLQRTEVYGYFFVMYITYVVLEFWLALLALFIYPSSASLEPLDAGVDDNYVVCFV